ncbi:hypothetical protein [Streptomyces sp. H27-H5]|uniref:hypothetical protein n=1 Tax=Streptomyces sp. H27-H5 TaxID=2996460 RepID=UPI002270406D|nr:hypothetical protein [Streptomyces sp. H27-H5]MCY0957757.1 hypothetical protein [Streptomyces sp. H27-H5]
MAQAAPTVGRAVHYVSHGTPLLPDGSQVYSAKCRAATVTEVNVEEPYQVGLAVTNPTGLHFRPLSEGGCFLYQPDGEGCELSPDEVRPGSWHWPERV